MKIGIMGTGNIACKMAKTINEMMEAENYAVASRSYEKAETFRREFGFNKAYGSYEEMLLDLEVELIYIALPHSHHYKIAKMCLEHGKPVLVEKAFTVNAVQAEEILELAKNKKIFITEAIWTRYMPMRKKLEEILQNDVIGEITSLTANLGAPISDSPRLMDPELAGGALLDLGVYPINFVFMVFGSKVKSITSSIIRTKTGVDAQNSIIISFEDDRTAILHSNMMSRTDCRGVINGNKGFIIVENINNWEQIKVFGLDKKEIACYERPKQITGYEYEVQASIKAINSGKIECDEMPHKETLRIMKTMDKLRDDWNLKFPCE